MLRTKIVCTLGPASDDEATIRAFLEAGWRGPHQFLPRQPRGHARHIEIVRRMADEMARPVAVLADFKGPSCGWALLPGQGMDLVEGETVLLVDRPPRKVRE